MKIIEEVLDKLHHTDRVWQPEKPFYLRQTDRVTISPVVCIYSLCLPVGFLPWHSAHAVKGLLWHNDPDCTNMWNQLVAFLRGWGGVTSYRTAGSTNKRACTKHKAKTRHPCDVTLTCFPALFFWLRSVIQSETLGWRENGERQRKALMPGLKGKQTWSRTEGKMRLWNHLRGY